MKNHFDSKVFFLHIPKAAGSSVNSYFQNLITPGKSLIHVESKPGWQKNANNYQYISGHVLYSNVFKNEYVKNSTKLVVLREPWEYLFSHLNWVARLAKPENIKLFNQRNPMLQTLSKKIFTANFTDRIQVEDFVANLTIREKSLIQNSQTRYLAKDLPKGSIASKENVVSALEGLNEFSFVGSVNTLQLFFDRISENFKIKKQIINPENTIQIKDSLGPVSEEGKSLLSELVDADLELYSAAEASELIHTLSFPA